MTSIVGLAGNIVSAHGVKIAAEQSAKVAEANAKEAERDAELARLSAQIDAEYITEDGEAAVARGRAIAAGQGASTTEGSPLIALMDMVGKNRRAVLRRQFQGEVEAAKFLTEAQFFKTKARATRIMGVYDHIATGLSGSRVGNYDMGGRGNTGSPTWGNSTQSSGFQQQRAGERQNYSSDSGGGDMGGGGTDMGGWDSAGGAL